MARSQPTLRPQYNRPTSFGYLTARPLVLSCAKALALSLPQLSLAAALPVPWISMAMAEEEEPPMSTDNPTLWIYMAVAVALVLLGGAFAGLTIALMGQDEIYLQVIKTSGEPHEQKHAARVLGLLQRGKHWVLVTLLLGNVITNETLPIVLDRSLGGGWPAVLGSTVLIVIFGEIIPQSVCVRYGLPIGAWMSPLVLILMWILGPVAWPTAKLLDRLLGEDHGTVYKKAGLKTLVTLHKSLGAAGEQLNQDEVTIISAVLDLKDKPVGDIMTPIENVFTMSADTVLNETTMEKILGAGYSRIPIYAPDNPCNFVGMLLVKMLITYDPEDAKLVRDFALATLPETRSQTSCLDIVNFFQEGKSHMVLVSEFPGDDHGALGVVTLEDVIEELIGEEIIDESDVYIDVHKAIRRLAPAPYSRVPKGQIVTEPDDVIAATGEDLIDVSESKSEAGPRANRSASLDAEALSGGKGTNGEAVPSPTTARPATRRTSSIAKMSDKESGRPRQMTPQMREHLKHLGPSNVASRPRSTRFNTVKIKPGAGSFADSVKSPERANASRQDSSSAAQGGVGAGLLSSAGKDASDGVLAVQAGYGTMTAESPQSRKSRRDSILAKASEEVRQARIQAGSGNANDRALSPKTQSRAHSQSTIDSLENGVKSPVSRRGVARSGSITEQIIEAGGIRKTVLEMTSSSSDVEDDVDPRAKGKSRSRGEHGGDDENEDTRRGGEVGKENDEPQDRSGRKKRRRRKRKSGEGGEGKNGNGGESEPLLD